MRLPTIAVGLALALLMPAQGSAQTEAQTNASEQGPLDRRAQDVVGWLRGEIAPQDLFTAQFLAQIPAETLAQMNSQLDSQFGAVLGVESVERQGPLRARIAIRFERAIGSGTMVLADTGEARIAGLQLSDFTPVIGDDADGNTDQSSAEAIAADLAALPGATAAWFGPLDGEPIFAYGDTERQFALGSAFKLYVLGAVSEAVAEGRLRWDQVVPLGQASFPSGITQSWPEGAPMTVQSLATLMISISDNTATDTLLKLVGRERVEQFLRRTGHSAPERSLPFLTTRELFLLKTLDNGPAYAEADVARRRAMLADLDGGGVTTEQVVTALGEPKLVEQIEWFASMEDERKLLRALVALDDPVLFDVLAVSPQLSETQRAGWAYAGFKGGSEPGVLNLTWLLKDEAGQWHMLAASWLNSEAAVENAALGLLAVRILALR